jgi:hypothetical protein
LILRDAMVWALASSSCARRSEFWDTASMWLPLPVAGPALPFLRTGPNEGEINATYPVNNRHGIAPPRNTPARSTGGNKNARQSSICFERRSQALRYLWRTIWSRPELLLANRPLFKEVR